MIISGYWDLMGKTLQDIGVEAKVLWSGLILSGLV